MSFTQAFLTKKGLDLCAKVLSGQELILHSIYAGTGEKVTDDFATQEALSKKEIALQYREIRYDENQPQAITIPIYYQNDQLQESITVTEIGIFATDPEEGEILFCILPSYDDPLPLPKLQDGRLELTMDVFLQLNLAPDVTITMPASIVFLTRKEADTLYATKQHRHVADQIDESNGYTTEVWQRQQDAEIEALKVKTDSGTTSAETNQRGTYPESNWMVLNDWGVYDAKRNVFYA